MQKVLLASTALVMTTGWAMADVTNLNDSLGTTIQLEGYGAMGVIGTDAGDDDSDDLGFATDIDVKFRMMGQTDGGLEFGAQIDLDETDSNCTSDEFEGSAVGAPGETISFLTGCRQSKAFDPEVQGGEEIYIRGAFGALYMGDTDGALDWALSEPDFGASIGDIEEHAGWNGNSGLDGIYDGQIARYEYAFGDFAVAVSGEIDDTGDGEPALGLGVKYSTNMSGLDMTFGAGVQTLSGLEDLGDVILDEDEDFAATIWGVTADIGMTNGFKTILEYSAANVDGLEDDVDPQYYGIALGYETGPLLVAANYGHFEDWVLFDTFDSEGYGLLANYDLGGGASLQGAYSHNTVGDDDFSTYSFGVAMDF